MPFLMASSCEPENAVNTSRRRRDDAGGPAGGSRTRPHGAPLDVAEVERRVDALREQVQRQGDEVDVARALAVAEQRALHPVGPASTANSAAATACRGRYAGAGWARWRRGLDGADEPLDRVGVHVRVNISTVVGRLRMIGRPRRLDHVHHRLADLDREIGSVPVKLSGEYS